MVNETRKQGIEERVREKYARLLDLTKETPDAHQLKEIRELFRDISPREYLALSRYRFKDIERLADNPSVKQILNIQRAGFQIYARMNRLKSMKEIQEACLYYGYGMNLNGELARINLMNSERC